MKDGVLDYTYISLNIKQCNDTKFYSENQDLYEKYGLSNYFCYDYDNKALEIGGNWDENELKYFYSYFYLCSKSRVNINNRKCSEDEIDLDYKNYYFSIFVPNISL